MAKVVAEGANEVERVVFPGRAVGIRRGGLSRPGVNNYVTVRLSDGRLGRARHSTR